ncbi:MAG: S49 family peptidase, partial [Methylobacteriaceae bacterium]
AILDGIEAQFIADVARGRGTTVAKVKSDSGAGGMKIGAAAVAAGMADRVQTYERSLSELARTASTERRARAARG